MFPFQSNVRASLLVLWPTSRHSLRHDFCKWRTALWSTACYVLRIRQIGRGFHISLQGDFIYFYHILGSKSYGSRTRLYRSETERRRGFYGISNL